VAASRQIESHESVARLHQSHEHCLIGLASGVRLDVGEGAAKQFLGARDRDLFGDINKLAAAVIATSRIALGIFVGEHRALGLQNCM
jgi:hypothetical protein